MLKVKHGEKWKNIFKNHRSFTKLIPLESPTTICIQHLEKAFPVWDLAVLKVSSQCIQKLETGYGKEWWHTGWMQWFHFIVFHSSSEAEFSTNFFWITLMTPINFLLWFFALHGRGRWCLPLFLCAVPDCVCRPSVSNSFGCQILVIAARLKSEKKHEKTLLPPSGHWNLVQWLKLRKISKWFWNVWRPT